MQADRGIAATPALAGAMQRLTGRPTLVVDNALSPQALSVAEGLRDQRRPRLGEAGSQVIIGYGSGTDTHDHDLALIAPVLADVLHVNPHVRLHLHGPVRLPQSLAGFEAQIRCVSLSGWAEFQEAMADWDIALAPLTHSAFNDAKSAIKWLEAASLGVPVIASPAASFRRAIMHGETGLLAGTRRQWRAALRRLIHDPLERARLGRTALQTALSDWQLTDLGPRQLGPLIRAARRGERAAPRLAKPARPCSSKAPAEGPHRALRLGVVNRFFHPKSYGGATIVAEQACRYLAGRGDIQPVVISAGAPPGHLAPGGLRRLADMDGVPVFAMGALRASDHLEAHEGLRARFRAVWQDLKVDVVHGHSLQSLTAAPIQAAMDLALPTLVTLHDAWWVCARSFMIQADGHHCGQWTLDPEVCSTCMGSRDRVMPRRRTLRGVLNAVDQLIAPSTYQRAFYIANGVAAERIAVLENGVSVPTTVTKRPPLRPERLRLAYMGGVGAHKGYHWLHEAIAGLPEAVRARIDLQLVDLGRRLGRDDIDAEWWAQICPTVLVPPYTQDGIDAFFAGVDVLVAPSLAPESFGLGVREALARHVWVVATRVGALADAIEPGVNGDVIEPGDTHSLRAALLHCVEAPASVRGHTNAHRQNLISLRDHGDALADLIHATVASHTDRLSVEARATS